MPDDIRPETAPPVRSSEIVSLCGLAMCEDAKRKMKRLHEGRYLHVNYAITAAFRIGFDEGVKSAQANDRTQRPGPP